MSMALLMIGSSFFTASSMGTGGTFSPPAVMINSEEKERAPRHYGCFWPITRIMDLFSTCTQVWVCGELKQTIFFHYPHVLRQLYLLFSPWCTGNHLRLSSPGLQSAATRLHPKLLSFCLPYWGNPWKCYVPKSKFLLSPQSLRWPFCTDSRAPPYHSFVREKISSCYLIFIKFTALKD